MTVSENIELEGGLVVEESACFVVKLAADSKAAKIVGMTDEATDILQCLLRYLSSFACDGGLVVAMSWSYCSQDR